MAGEKIQLKPEEQVAAAFLEKCYGHRPRYEPLGRDKPPDFGIGGIAFEVRRLNQYYVGADGEEEALEQVAVRLLRGLMRALEEIPYNAARGTLVMLSERLSPLSHLSKFPTLRMWLNGYDLRAMRLLDPVAVLMDA